MASTSITVYIGMGSSNNTKDYFLWKEDEETTTAQIAHMHLLLPILLMVWYSGSYYIIDKCSIQLTQVLKKKTEEKTTEQC